MAYINGKKILHTIKAEYIEVHPSVVDTEAYILALTSDKGLAVATDTGYWYYWDSTTSQYTYGGVYFSAQNVISHNNNQLLDENGNNLNPISYITPSEILKTIKIE